MTKYKRFDDGNVSTPRCVLHADRADRIRGRPLLGAKDYIPSELEVVTSLKIAS